MKHNETDREKNPMEIMRHFDSFFFINFQFCVPAHEPTVDSLTSYTVNKTMMMIE